MNITKIILISLILTTSCDSRVENKLTETFDDKITWNELDEFPSVKAVSYTHLTLPTKA